MNVGVARAIVRAGGGGTRLNAGDCGLCEGKNYLMIIASFGIIKINFASALTCAIIQQGRGLKESIDLVFLLLFLAIIAISECRVKFT